MSLTWEDKESGVILYLRTLAKSIIGLCGTAAVVIIIDAP